MNASRWNPRKVGVGEQLEAVLGNEGQDCDWLL